MQFIMAPGRLKLIVGVVAYRHSCIGIRVNACIALSHSSNVDNFDMTFNIIKVSKKK